MPHIIIVDDEQARLIKESGDPIEIRDRSGQHLGFVAHDFTDDDVAIAEERRTSAEPRFTTQQVLEHLRSLGSK